MNCTQSSVTQTTRPAQRDITKMKTNEMAAPATGPMISTTLWAL